MFCCLLCYVKAVVRIQRLEWKFKDFLSKHAYLATFGSPASDSFTRYLGLIGFTSSSLILRVESAKAINSN